MKFTLKQIQDYCKDHGIFITKTATRTEMEAAVSRSYFHMSEISEDCCFGYWGEEDMNCRLCDHGDECFKASVGIQKDKYFRSLDRCQNGFKFKEPLRKKCRRGSKTNSCLI